MGNRLQPGQAEEAAGAFDGVDKPEDVVQHVLVVRVLFELDQLDVDDVDALGRLGQKLVKQIVHSEGAFREV